MKRNVHKRLDLNEAEAIMLRVKAQQTHLAECQYLRELIMGSCPAEAPGKEFYEAIGRINKIGVNINQIAAVANTDGYIPPETVDEIRNLAERVVEGLCEIKKIVLSARPYANSYYEAYVMEVQKAKKEGRPVPEFGDLAFIGKD